MTALIRSCVFALLFSLSVGQFAESFFAVYTWLLPTEVCCSGEDDTCCNDSGSCADLCCHVPPFLILQFSDQSPVRTYHFQTFPIGNVHLPLDHDEVQAGVNSVPDQPPRFC